MSNEMIGGPCRKCGMQGFFNCCEESLDSIVMSDSSDCYAAYRLAGEFFGRLQNEIKFGQLTMFHEDGVLSFAWEFSAKGKQYRSQWNMELFEFSMTRDLAADAERLVRSWKNDHRKVSA